MGANDIGGGLSFSLLPVSHIFGMILSIATCAES